MDFILKVLSEFQSQHPDIYIGGSVSLMLQNAIPNRVPHDIDIISPKKIHIFEIFNITDKIHHPLTRIHRHQNLKFELFCNPNASYLEYNWEGNILKLSPIEEVFKWKFKEQNISRPKHKSDIESYYGDIYL